MPFYEYRCETCGHQLEVLQKIADAPLLYCPECGEARLKKLVSRSAFRLKGGGWYATDFKNSGAPPDDKRGKDGAGESKGEGADKAAGDKNGTTGGGKSASQKSASASAETLQKSA